MIQQVGWAKFMSHIGSLMAEQADKVERGSTQDTALFQCSSFIHAATDMWKDCGFYDYRPLILLGWVPEEQREMIEMRAMHSDTEGP